MREGISIEVSAADRERLAAVEADRNSPQKHVWRARIILATAQGCGTAEITSVDYCDARQPLPIARGPRHSP